MVTLTVLKNIGKVFCRLILWCNLPNIFLRIYGFSKGRSQRWNAIFIRSLQGYMLSIKLNTVDVDFGHLPEVVFLSFYHQITLLTFHTVHFGKKSQCAADMYRVSWKQNCCSVAKSRPILHNPIDCSTLGFPVPHHLLEFVQVHVHWVSDSIQPSHPLLPSSPFAFNFSQNQGLFQWVNSSHQVAFKVLEYQLQHQPFQWVFRVDFL